MFSKLLKAIRSLKLTVFLIICLTVVILVGVIVPQKSLLGRDLYLKWKDQNPALVTVLEAAHLTDVYTAPFTLLLWGFFFLNLALVMSGRIPVIWKRFSRLELPKNSDQTKKSRHYTVLEGVGLKDIEKTLSESGYRVFGSKGAFLAVKNRFSPLATILFHLSFFIFLIGGVTTFYTRFIGEADVAVGETFTGEYNRIKPPKLGDIPKTTFTVESITPYYYKKNVPTGLDVVLLTPKGREVIGINRPYNEGALSFVIKGVDVAPLFVVLDTAGKEIDGAYVKLKVINGREDSFNLAGYDFRALFYTDFLSAADKGIATENLPQILQTPMAGKRKQPQEITNPAFSITISQKGRVIGQKTVMKGGEISFDDKRLIFTDFIYWARFSIIKEYGMGFIYAGSIFMTIALIVRFGFYRRDLRGVVEDGTVHLGGTCEYFPVLFVDEFSAIVERIKRSLPSVTRDGHRPS